MTHRASTFVEDENFGALVTVMRSSPKPLALVGAGASIPSGYPSWGKLIDGLEDLMRTASNSDATVAKRGSEIPPKYGSFLKGQDPAWQAEEYVRMIGPEVFAQYIQRTFDRRGEVAEPHHLIARLEFSHYLTTNFDPCIGLALEGMDKPCTILDWYRPEDLNSFICDLANREGRRYVVHLHGRHSDSTRVVLTESSYVDRYLSNDDTRLKLLAVFMTHPVVFIGFSMNDPDLTHLLREVTARVRRASPRHFAIVGAESDEEQSATASRMMGKFGVRPVFYRLIRRDKDTEDHGGLPLLLKRLAELTGLAVPPAQATLLQPALSTKNSLDSDPHKGAFGGSHEANGRRLRLAASRVIERNQWMSLSLVVERLEGFPPLEGTVRMYLHPTFDEPEYDIDVIKDVAKDTISATGAFTIGVVADGGRTRLELDLAKSQALPQWFRDR